MVNCCCTGESCSVTPIRSCDPLGDQGRGGGNPRPPPRKPTLDPIYFVQLLIKCLSCRWILLTFLLSCLIPYFYYLITLVTCTGTLPLKIKHLVTNGANCGITVHVNLALTLFVLFSDLVAINKRPTKVGGTYGFPLKPPGGGP